VHEDGFVKTSGDDVDVALSAAAAGAAVVRAAYGAVHVRYSKSGPDFATETDLDAERAIFRVIETARPNDTRIGEESGDRSLSDGERRTSAMGTSRTTCTSQRGSRSVVAPAASSQT
jgi:hypothetical protein